ncbi:MAG: hypothetical protein AMXMBFR7_42260 [Planctomycetota bacterium]
MRSALELPPDFGMYAASAEISPMPRPTFVWSDPHGRGRNVFVLFRRSFALASVPRRAELRLFADTRYRLWVNGRVAAYGPARFALRAPEFDSIDLVPFLKAGRNAILVEVNSKGASSFEAQPSIGGFAAAGSVGSGSGAIDLTTPGAWKCRRADAWFDWAPSFSFAQGPTEIVDLRRLPMEWYGPKLDERGWQEPIAIEAQDHWGEWSPRSIPMLGMDECLPEKVHLAAPLLQDEVRIGYQEPGPIGKSGSPRPRTCYATYLHSPVAQKVKLALFWGPHYLNGVEFKGTYAALGGNRQEADVELAAGANFLYGEPEMLTEGWGFLLGWPHSSGLVASTDANPSRTSGAVLLHAGPVPTEELAAVRAAIPKTIEELPEFSRPWVRVPRGAEPPLPAREMAWDRPGESVALDPYQVGGLDLSCAPGCPMTAVFDFGREVLGHTILEIDAPKGAIVDVALDERLREDGCVALFKSHFMVNAADRFVARGGGERIEGFHPRGGRYLQVTVRNSDRPVRLKRIALRETVYPLSEKGSFACGDPLFNWVHQTAFATLRACMEDGYIDCPWRERGVYVGDAWVQYLVQRAYNEDPRLVRRCLKLWADTQKPSGQMFDVVPAWRETDLPDYTLIWLLVLRDFWALTGDRKLVEALWPCVEKIFASPVWREEPSGLWNADGLHVYLDAMAMKDAKQGENGALNVFRIQALRAASELADVLKRPKESKHYRREAARVLKSINHTLWLSDEGRFAATRKDGALLREGALHVNALMLAFGLARPKQAQSMLTYVERCVEENPKRAPGSFGSYFAFYVLNALYDHGRSDLAERLIRRNYGLMRAGGAWTLWEFFHDRSSLCHAWSGAPAHCFATRALGVRQNIPGKLDEILLAPDSATLTWVRGAVPHRRGLIEVSWRLEAGGLVLEASVPRGLKVKVKPAGALSRLPFTFQVHRK